MRRGMTIRKGVSAAVLLAMAALAGCLCARKESSFGDGRSGRPLPADMTLAERIALNMERLSGGKYLPERIFDRDDWGWPGDTEGRVLLALVLEGQALGRTPPTMERLFRDVVAHFNAEGYMGPIRTETVSEQQLFGNGWILRALCAYARSTSEPAVDAKALASRLAENLYLKALGRYKDYPIDPKVRAAGEGSAVGSKSRTVGGWELSTDIGAAFAALDGLTDVYALTGNGKLKPLIEEIAVRFAECDPVVLQAQTHSTLTTLRALLRYDAKRFLPLVEKRFAQYREFGMTDRAENYNWFCRYDTWTEPCAIVDSLVVAETLWRETGNRDYRDLAERILTVLVGHQRDNGGFGLRKTFPRGSGAPVVDHTYEAHWCCTMRGGAGLAWALMRNVTPRTNSTVKAVSCPRGVSWEEPAPGLDYGRIYYYVPESLDLSARPGLFIFLHGGGGEVNTQPEKYLSPTNGWLRPHIDALPCITVAATAPHARGDHWRWNHPDAEKEILAIIEAVDAKVPIDRDRIFLGGQSMGGFGAYHLGQVLADRLAGVWAAAGAWCAADFRSMRGTPMFIQHGIYDCAPGYSNEPRPRAQFQTGFSFARAAHELMERDGVEHVFSPYAGGHGLSSPEAQESTRRFVRWASTLRRQPYAPAVTVVTPCGADKPCLVRRTRSHWLEVTGTRPGTVDLDTIELSEYGRAATWSEFEAQTYRLNRKRFSGFRLEGFNRGDNRFEVRVENVTTFRIYLAPQMGDLSRPFTVDAGPLGRQVLTAKEVAGEKDYSAVLEFVSVRNPPAEPKTVSVRPKATDEVLSNPGMGFVVYRRDGNPWTYEPLATPDDTVDWFPCADVVAIRLPWRTLLPEAGPARWDLIDTYAAPWVAKGKRFAIGIVGEDAPDGFLAALLARYADNPGLAFVQVDSPAERERWRKALPGVPVLTEGVGEPSLYSQTMQGNGMLSLHWDAAALNAGIEKARASYFGLRWFPEVLHRNNEELYLGIARRLGYRFELRDARFPDVIAAGKPVRIETDWVNVGVARCTVPAFVSYSLLDDAGRVAWTWTDASADLRKAEPKAGSAEKMLKTSVECVFGYGCEVPAEGDPVAENARRRFRLGAESPLQMLKPGVYTLAVSVGNADGWATIALPLEKGANRIYPVGTVTVVEEE